MKIIFLCVMTFFAMQENHRKLLLDQISTPAHQFEIKKFRTLFSSLHKKYDGKEIAKEVSEVILENLYQNIDLKKTKIFATFICDEFPDLCEAIVRKLQDDWESNKFPDRYLPILLFLHSRRGFRHIFEQVKEDISQDPLRKKSVFIIFGNDRGRSFELPKHSQPKQEDFKIRSQSEAL